jgi:apolipoprotein N-acyltransferase
MRTIFKSDAAGNASGFIFFIGGIAWEIAALKEYFFGGLISVLLVHIAVVGIIAPLLTAYLGWRLFRYKKSEELTDAK